MEDLVKDKVAIISANLGAFEKPVPHVKQSIDCDIFLVTDKEFPLRDKAMTPRMQARIVKMFGWQMFPGYSHYLWVDSSCQLNHHDSVKFFLEQLDGSHMAFFRHPTRNTIQEEADYLKKRLAMPDTYITSRYENELIDEQLEEINKYGSYKDDSLFASTAFIYTSTYDVQRMLKEWWYHTSRYHVIDQLSLPYVINNYKSYLKIKTIEENFMKCDYLKPVRK